MAGAGLSAVTQLRHQAFRRDEASQEGIVPRKQDTRPTDADRFVAEALRSAENGARWKASTRAQELDSACADFGRLGSKPSDRLVG